MIERKNGHFKKRCVAVKCEICGKTHIEMCYLKTGACFRCGKLGHKVRNYPKQWMKLW